MIDTTLASSKDEYGTTEEFVAKLAMNSKALKQGTDEFALATSEPAVLEPKYDGIRLLIHVGEDGVQAFARSGKSKTGKLPAIEAELFEHLPMDTWIDGEAVAFNDNGTQDWGGAQSVLGSGTAKAALRSGAITFVVFDLLAFDGTDCRSLPFSDRRELLEEIFDERFTKVVLPPQVEPTAEAHQANLVAGFEGSMLKHLSAKYESGKRSAHSLKIKATDTVDCVITGFGDPAPDSWIAAEGLIGTVVFEHYGEDGRAIEGRCSGMTVAEREMLTHYQDELIGRVIEVSYMTKMPSGTLRHPQFKRIRDDKTAEECKA